MTRSTPLPNLFGHLTELLSQHEDLGSALRRLDELCDALDARRKELPEYLEPLPLLTALGDGLSAHFRTEEGESYYRGIAREAPGLAHHVGVLERQHAAMLGVVRELRTLAERGDTPYALSALARRFISELRTHEHAENRLMQEFVLRDDGTAAD